MPRVISVDLNADLGELAGDAGQRIDAGLLEVVTSANVAAGGHAGDHRSMARVCRLAAAHEVRIGAHLSFVDRVGFGRRVPDRIDARLVRDLRGQLDALLQASEGAGSVVSYVKAHGALYNLALDRRDVAEVVIEAIADSALPILTMHGSVLQEMAKCAALPTFAEFFADRGYLPNGRLVPRGTAGDVLQEGIEDRVLQAVTTGSILDSTGQSIDVQVDSICVHGDTPGAVDHARRIRARLELAGITLRAFTCAPTSQPAGSLPPNARNG